MSSRKSFRTRSGGQEGLAVLSLGKLASSEKVSGSIRKASSTLITRHLKSELFCSLNVADRATLTAQLAVALARLRKPRARYDPGGATTISDVAVLVDQAELFGAVASDSTTGLSVAEPVTRLVKRVNWNSD